MKWAKEKTTCEHEDTRVMGNRGGGGVRGVFVAVITKSGASSKQKK